MKGYEKKFDSFVHNETARLVQYQCFECKAYVAFKCDIKDKGHSICPICGEVHRVSIFKNGKASFMRD